MVARVGGGAPGGERACRTRPASLHSEVYRDVVATRQRDPASWFALALAGVALALPAIALVPDLVQEVLTMVLLAVSGGVVAVFAMAYGVAAFQARRAAHRSAAVSGAAIALSVLPMAGAVLLLPSLGCYVGEGCGGG
jgi:hypothetical protein